MTAHHVTSSSGRLDAISPCRVAATHSRPPIELSVVDFGGKGHQPVICLPGTAEMPHDFGALAFPLVDAGHHVLSFHQRGTFKSGRNPDDRDYAPGEMVKDVGVVLDNCVGTGDKAVLVGSSVGGIQALLFAAFFPHRVRGVVLLDAAPDIDSRRLQTIRSVVGRTCGTENEARSKFGKCPQSDGNDYLARRKDGSWGFDIDERLLDMVNAELYARCKLVAPFVTCPFLLLRGQRSSLVSREAAEEFRACFKDSCQLTIGEVPNAGHRVLVDNPQAVLESITKFLGQLTS